MNFGKILAVAAGAGAFTALSVWNYRRYMPKARPLNEENHPVLTTVRKIETQGRVIYGELLTPADAKGPLPTVICCHGYGSSYKLTKGCVGLPLAMSGYVAYCFDFCGGSQKSKSSGSFHDMTIFKEKDDLLAVIVEMKTWPEVDEKNLFLLGESQGGMVAGITAPERQDDLRAMVLYYPAFCIPDDARRKFPGKESIPDEVEAFKLNIGGDYYRSTYDFDVYETIKAFEKPVLILHGDADEVVPHRYGKQAAEVYPDAEFITFPGEVHGFMAKGKRRAAELSYQFFEKNRG